MDKMDEIMNGWIGSMGKIDIWTDRHDRWTCGWTSQWDWCILVSFFLPKYHCVSLVLRNFLEKITHKSIFGLTSKI